MNCSSGRVLRSSAAVPTAPPAPAAASWQPLPALPLPVGSPCRCQVAATESFTGIWIQQMVATKPALIMRAQNQRYALNTPEPSPPPRRRLSFSLASLHRQSQSALVAPGSHIRHGRSPCNNRKPAVAASIGCAAHSPSPPAVAGGAAPSGSSRGRRSGAHLGRLGPPGSVSGEVRNLGHQAKARVGELVEI